MVFSKLAHITRSIKLHQLRIQINSCPLCGHKFQVKLFNDEMGVRCLKCRGSAVTQSLAAVFDALTTGQNSLSVYELSSRGAWHRFLNQSSHRLTCSEYFDGIPLGEQVNGISCQDVQQLTYADEQFDVCTSLEVFEHVEDDHKGFSEIFRVLKPEGLMLFTVPLSGQTKTIERTAIIQGKRQQTLPAEYHSDSLRGAGQVFCFRNYGSDVIKRLESVGCTQVEIIEPHNKLYFGFGRPVIKAIKPK